MPSFSGRRNRTAFGEVCGPEGRDAVALYCSVIDGMALVCLHSNGVRAIEQPGETAERILTRHLAASLTDYQPNSSRGRRFRLLSQALYVISRSGEFRFQPQACAEKIPAVAHIAKGISHRRETTTIVAYTHLCSRYGGLVSYHSLYVRPIVFRTWQSVLIANIRESNPCFAGFMGSLVTTGRTCKDPWTLSVCQHDWSVPTGLGSNAAIAATFTDVQAVCCVLNHVSLVS